MNKKYTCENCRYKTDHKGNFNKHLLSRKHKLKNTEKSSQKEDKSSQKEDKSSQKEDKKLSECKYCKLKITYGNFSRHKRNCKEKHIHEIENKSKKKINKLLKLNKKRKRIADKRGKIILQNMKEKEKWAIEKEQFIWEKQQFLREKEQLLQDKRQIEIQRDQINKDFHDYIKNNEPNNKNVYNLTYSYVVNNFNNALDFNEVMKPDITEDEFNENDLCLTAVNIFKNRCLNNIKPDQRPIHCLDVNRNKFVVNMENYWVIDYQGEKILGKIYQKISKKYPNKSTDEVLKLATIYSKKRGVLKHMSQEASIKNLKHGEKTESKKLSRISSASIPGITDSVSTITIGGVENNYKEIFIKSKDNINKYSISSIENIDDIICDTNYSLYSRSFDSVIDSTNTNSIIDSIDTSYEMYDQT